MSLQIKKTFVDYFIEQHVLIIFSFFRLTFVFDVDIQQQVTPTLIKDSA
jgi:hypothetical protein